jgi:hypothetical protein
MALVPLPSKLAAQEIALSLTSVYTAATKTVIHNIKLANTTNAAKTITLSLLYGAADLQLDVFALPAYGSLQYAYQGEGIVLEQNDAIKALASGAGVNIFVWGSTLSEEV